MPYTFVSRSGKLIPWLALLALAGCQHATITPPSTVFVQPLHPSARVYIAAPRDAGSGPKQYTGSGDAVALALEAAFCRNGGSTAIGAPAATAADAVSMARDRECDIVVWPQIAPAEGQAGSVVNDNLVLSVQVFRAADGLEISRTEIAGEASWFTFGGDHPHDLLRGPIDTFVNRLF